jgi:adenylate cyclase class IV
LGAPRRNLELKASDPDPAATLAAALALGATDQGTLHQRDTYFHVRPGPAHPRLKLREAPPATAEEPRVRELCEALNITGDQLVARGYADLLERRL